jgi:hypothetical protein
MAQTGFTPILIYSSSTTTNAPAVGNLTNSTLGSELAINITDGKLFYKDNANAIQVIAWKTTPTTAGGTGLISYTAGDLLYYATGTTLSKLGIGTSNQILKSTGSAPAWESVGNLAVTSIGFGTTGLTPSAATQGAVTVAGTLVAVNGGTGQSSYVVGDILFASTTTALSRLADVATGNALISGGVGVAPSWGKIGLTTHVSGTLPVANGGTGVTSSTGTTNVVLSNSPTLVTPKGVQGSLTLGPSSGNDFKSGGTFMAFATFPVAVTITGIDFQYIQSTQDNTLEVFQYQVAGSGAVTLADYTGTAAGTRTLRTTGLTVAVAAGTRFFVGPNTSSNNNQANINVAIEYTTA